MTKRFQYTTERITRRNGEWVMEPIILHKTVTDRMEERDSWKRVYAANWFKAEIARKYGKGFSVSVHNSGFEEI